MKFNISNPATAQQKLIEIDDERKLRMFFDKRMGQEIDGEALGDEFKGYIFRITGGNDKQGFGMMQGVLLPERTRLLLSKGAKLYRPRRTGERKRKSVRGCIVAHNMSVVNLAMTKKGEAELPGLTDKNIPRRLGPKRASKIRKLFNLSKEDDVRKYVIRREVPNKKDENKPKSKAPKIQRLVTPVVLQRKRHRLALKRNRAQKAAREAQEYHALVAKRQQEAKAKRAQAHAERRRTNSQ